jgi:murein endopeptidase
MRSARSRPPLNATVEVRRGITSRDGPHSPAEPYFGARSLHSIPSVRLVLLIMLAALVVPAALLAAPREPSPEPPSVVVPVPTPSPLPPVATPAPAPAPLPPVTELPRSRSVGQPWAGRLVNGRRLPPSGEGFLTWDPILKRVGNRPWRRWGTERLLATVRSVVADYARRHPGARPVLVGDLSRRRGGDFGPRFGGIGHASHQNGLDVDIYYPRDDGRLRAPVRPRQVDLAAAQELVDAFVAQGAVNVFVGPSLGLRGPRRIVSPLVHHDNHLHVRLASGP